jgi:hypothetical protein
MAPFAPQRLAPTVQLVAQVLQAPFWQKLFAPHCCAGPHAGQLFWSTMQVSTPAVPWQRVWPVVQLVPQLPQAPPLQKSAQVLPACHEVQPWALATQVSTVLPAQRFAPAVQVVLHAAQLPFWQTLPLAQGWARHWVQPESTFHSQVSTPVAVQREAPWLQAWQVLHWPPAHSSP